MNARMTLEQQRAQDAWKSCQEMPAPASAYVSVAKSMPALIMNSGLMQTLAFMHSRHAKDNKGKGRGADRSMDREPVEMREGASAHALLERQLCRWLAHRFASLDDTDFIRFMDSLMKCRPQEFQLITIEALAWLRWTRQFASAVAGVQA